MALEIDEFVLSASTEDDMEPVLSPETVQVVPDEEEVEELLSAKLMNGFMLLDQPCPKCMIPLVKQPARANSETTIDENPGEEKLENGARIVTNLSMDGIPKPLRGIPFCVTCESYVVTNPSEARLLEHMKASDNFTLGDETEASLDSGTLLQIGASMEASQMKMGDNGTTSWLSQSTTNKSSVFFRTAIPKSKRSRTAGLDTALSMNSTMNSEKNLTVGGKSLMGLAASQEEQGVEMKLDDELAETLGAEKRDDSSVLWKDTNDEKDREESDQEPNLNILSNSSDEDEIADSITNGTEEATKKSINDLKRDAATQDQAGVDEVEEEGIEESDIYVNRHDKDDANNDDDDDSMNKSEMEIVSDNIHYVETDKNSLQEDDEVETCQQDSASNDDKKNEQPGDDSHVSSEEMLADVADATEQESWGEKILKLAKSKTAETVEELTLDDVNESKSNDLPGSEEYGADNEADSEDHKIKLMNNSMRSASDSMLDKIEKTALALTKIKSQQDQREDEDSTMNSTLVETLEDTQIEFLEDNNPAEDDEDGQNEDDQENQNEDDQENQNEDDRDDQNQDHKELYDEIKAWKDSYYVARSTCGTPTVSSDGRCSSNSNGVAEDDIMQEYAVRYVDFA
jgi:hypothetical protein